MWFHVLTTVRFAAPSVESYAKQVEELQLDLDMTNTEEDKRQVKDKIAGKKWRALRIASKDRHRSYDKLNSGKHLGSLFQPDTAMEVAASEEGAPSAPEDKDSVPQEQHQSAEEQRAD